MTLASFTLNARPAWGPVVDGGVIDAIAFLPTIPDPGKVWCCGLNYHAHLQETGRVVTEQPTFFTRWADAQVGHGQPMLRPRESVQFDYEGEMVTADEIPFGTSMTRVTRLNGAERTPPLWMKPGDVVEIEVDRVGVLRNPIAQE